MVANATTSTQTVTATCFIAPSTVGSCKQVKKLTLLLQAEIAYSPGSVFQYFYSKQLNPGKYTSYSNILCRHFLQVCTLTLVLMLVNHTAVYGIKIIMLQVKESLKYLGLSKIQQHVPPTPYFSMPLVYYYEWGTLPDVHYSLHLSPTKWIENKIY